MRTIVTQSIIRPTLVYIIRLWAEPADGTWIWRLSLQPVLSDQAAAPLGFGTLEHAVAFLQQAMVEQTRLP